MWTNRAAEVCIRQQVSLSGELAQAAVVSMGEAQQDTWPASPKTTYGLESRDIMAGSGLAMVGRRTQGEPEMTFWINS